MQKISPFFRFLSIILLGFLVSCQPTCDDGIMNGDETGIDCGGDCLPCYSCDDGIQNGDETGVDCGGDCDPCPTCDDGIQNGNEEGVDCGGECPDICQCANGIRDGNEYCVDCGGDCEECDVMGDRYLVNLYPDFPEMDNETFYRSGVAIEYGQATYPSGIERPLTARIYESPEDIEENRPLVIMCGGGATLIKPINEQLYKYGKDLVGKGFVCAEVDVRHYDVVGDLPDFTKWEDAVIKARADMLAAIRYFKKEATELRIDPENIWLMGYSGGGLVCLYAAYMNESDQSDLEASTLAVIDNNGGWEGNSGNPGFDTSVKGVINMAGFMAHEDLVDPGEPLLFGLIGANDDAHPQGTGPINNPMMSEGFTAYGTKTLMENLPEAKFKIIYASPADAYAPVDFNQCPECPDEVSDYMAVRMFCAE